MRACLFVQLFLPLNSIGFFLLLFILVLHSKDFADGLCEGCKAVSDILLQIFGMLHILWDKRGS